MGSYEQTFYHLCKGLFQSFFITNNSIILSMADQAATPICSKCNTTVRPKQQILECDRCLRFLHRTCVPTSMTQHRYRTAKKAGIRIGFQCPGSCPEWNLPPAPVVASNPGDPLALSEPAAPRALFL